MRLAAHHSSAHLRGVPFPQSHWQRLARQRALIHINAPLLHLYRVSLLNYSGPRRANAWCDRFVNPYKS